MSKQDLDYLARQLASVEQAIRNLDVSFDRGIESIIRELRTTREELKTARKEMGIKLLALMVQHITSDYLEIVSREKALEQQVSYMEQKTEEARKFFYERLREILNNYLEVVRDYLLQFLNMSEEEFAILQKFLMAEQRVELIRELIKPGWVNEELMKVVLGFDVKTRTENLETLISDLERIRITLISQKESLNAVKKVISDYSLPSNVAEPGTVLYLPILIVESEVNGQKFIGIKKPLDGDAPLTRLLADEAFQVRDEYILEVSKKDLEQIFKKITTLASTANEKKLFEKVKVEVM